MGRSSVLAGVESERDRESKIEGGIGRHTFVGCDSPVEEEVGAGQPAPRGG